MAPFWRPPLTVLKSERLDLTELTSRDAAFILELLNEPGFLRFIGDKGVRTLADARRYIAIGPVASYREHGFGLYLVSLRAGGVPLGICGLVKRDTLPSADLGFAFLARHCAKGYATEAAAAVLADARQRSKGGPIIAITALDNEASGAVLEKIGLEFKGLVRLVPEGPELRLFGCPKSLAEETR